MKKGALLFFAFVLSWGAILAQEKSDLVKIREELFYTDFDLDKCVNFYKKVAAHKMATATITAYEAAAKALIAKHSWNPVTKIGSLKEALTLLEHAVQSDQTNLEIRFLRLYIENSLPSYIGTKDNIETDKKMILDNIDKLDASDLNADIVQYILKYMSTAVACTTDEIKVIHARLL